MTTPLEIVTDALLSLGAIEGGEPAPPEQANDAFRFLNKLLDQLSNEKQMLFCVQEVIHELTANDQTYTIGPSGDVGATFTGSIAGSVLTVTALSAGALSVGQVLAGSTSTNGQVATVTAVTEGLGYLGLPSLVFSGGTTGAAAAANATLKAIAVMQVFAAGAAYTSGDVITLSGGVFTRAATFRLLTSSPSTPILELIDGGAYQVLPGTVGTSSGINITGFGGTLGVTGGTGAGMQLIVTWGLGTPVITGVGSGYFANPTVTVAGGGSNIAGTAAATITQVGTSIIAGTAITSLGTALGGNGVNALGTYYLNLPQTIASSTITSSAPRPLRINSAFVRVVNSLSGTLDYPVKVLNVEQYERIGQKTMPGPWPYAVYYQPSMPVGILNYYPNPTQGEMHLFCDTVLNRFATLNDTVILPQGYEMALTWMLAEMLMPQYPSTAAAAETRALIPAFALQGRALIKRTNMAPPPVMEFDPIFNMSKKNDAGWILNGGFS